MNKLIRIHIVLVAMTFGLIKNASANRDCSEIESYELIHTELTRYEKKFDIRFLSDAVSQEKNMNTSCISVQELSRESKYYIEGYNCREISYVVRHFNENRNLIKTEFAVMPYEHISPRKRIDDKIYSAGEVLGSAMDLVGPAVAVVVGPVVGIGDSIADFAEGADRRNIENRIVAHNQVLRTLESEAALPLCQK